MQVPAGGRRKHHRAKPDVASSMTRPQIVATAVSALVGCGYAIYSAMANPQSKDPVPTGEQPATAAERMQRAIEMMEHPESLDEAHELFRTGSVGTHSDVIMPFGVGSASEVEFTMPMHLYTLELYRGMLNRNPKALAIFETMARGTPASPSMDVDIRIRGFRYSLPASWMAAWECDPILLRRLIRTGSKSGLLVSGGRLNVSLSIWHLVARMPRWLCHLAPTLNWWRNLALDRLAAGGWEGGGKEAGLRRETFENASRGHESVTVDRNPWRVLAHLVRLYASSPAMRAIVAAVDEGTAPSSFHLVQHTEMIINEAGCVCRGPQRYALKRDGWCSTHAALSALSARRPRPSHARCNARMHADALAR